MAPKKGTNPKATAAKERKAEAKEKDRTQKAQATEDAAWAAAGEGAKSKAQAKKEDQARQREEAAAKKAEAKRMAAEEDAAMSATKPAKSKVTAAPKVTSHQLQVEREARQKELQKEQEQRKKDQKKMVSEEAYGQLVASPNLNKGEPDTVEARSVGEAISALNVGDAAEEDRHPERRAKAAFEAFQERELPALKSEKPGLKQSQYKDMLWKSWQKSPQNPLYRVRQ